MSKIIFYQNIKLITNWNFTPIINYKNNETYITFLHENG